MFPPIVLKIACKRDHMSLSGPWTLAESEFGSALIMCVRAHNLLRPPPPPHKNPGSAPAIYKFSVKCIMIVASPIAIRFQWRIQRGRNRRPPLCPLLQFDRLCLLIPFRIRMLTNIQGGPERMQRLWSLISRTSSIKRISFLFYWVEN